MLSSSYHLSPFFLSLLLTASLPPSSQSSSSLLLLPHSFPSTSSLPISLLPLSHPHYLSPSFFLFSTYLPPCSPLLNYLSPFFLSFLLTASLPPFSQSSSSTSPPSFLSIHFITIALPPSSESSSPPPSSQSSSSLPLSPSSPSFSLPLSLLPLASSSLPLSFLPLNPPHYFSPSFLSILLTTSLPTSSQSSSLPLSLLPLSHPHYLSPSFLPVILTTSPSFIPFNPPPHYLSSLSCNIIIHLITSVFLPSPSSLLTLPNYLLRILFSSVVIIILLITSSSLLLSSSFTFITSSFLSSSFKSPLQYLFHYFLLTISILFHIDSLPNSSPSSSLLYTSSISPSSPSSFYHSPSVLSILLFIFLPSCPLPHTCQLCLPALSKLEFFSLALRKIALSLKCFSHPFLLPALVITIIIVDTLFRPHLTIMSSTIYMNISVHKKNPIKKWEGKN